MKSKKTNATGQDYPINLIRNPEVRMLFLDKKRGVPLTEKLMSLEDICSELDKPLPKQQPARGYALMRNINTINTVKKFFTNHNVVFLAVNIEKVIYYGLSQKQEMRDNYMLRLNGKTKAHKTVETKAKNLCSGQIELFDNKQSLLPAK